MVGHCDPMDYVAAKRISIPMAVNPDHDRRISSSRAKFFSS